MIIKASPVEKWINIVKKWNSCKNHTDNERVRQRMLFCMAEAEELMKQYPDMRKDIKAFAELDYFQIEMLRYSGTYFSFEYPEHMINPLIVGSYSLLNN